MNGMEMALNSILKLLHIDQAAVMNVINNVQNVQAAANAMNARMARIEENQKRILELLGDNEPNPGAIVPALNEDNSNANVG